MTHTVAAIHFARRHSRIATMECSCSWSGQWGNDVALEEAWREHRREIGLSVKLSHVRHGHDPRREPHIGKAPIDARSMHDR